MPSFSLSPHKKTILLMCLLAVLTFVTFSPVLKAQFLNIGDDQSLTNNPNILTFDIAHIKAALKRPVNGLYTPLTNLFFSLENHIFGLHPFVFHLTNLLLHITIVLLSFLLACNLGLSPTIAFLGAFIFSLHPSQAEVVAWVAQRHELLCAALYLGSLIAYQRKSRGLSVVLAFLSMLSDSLGLTLPLVLILMDWFTKTLDMKKILGLWPYFLAAIFVGYITHHVHGHFLVLPYPEVRFAVNRLVYLPSVLFCVLIAWLIGTIYRFLQTQEAFIRYLFSAAVTALMAGLMLLTFNECCIWHDAVSLWRHQTKLGTNAMAYDYLAGTLRDSASFKDEQEILALYNKSIKIDPSYTDVYIHLSELYQSKGQAQEALLWYNKALKVDSNSKDALFGLGLLYQKMDQPQRSVEAFKRLLKAYPDNEKVYTSVISAYSQAILNYPQEKIYQEQREEVLSEYEELSKRKKYSAVDYFNLGFLYEQVGGYEEAIRFYKNSLEINPTYEKSLYNLANRYQEMGEFKTALILYQRLIHFHPKYALGYLNMGVIYNSMGNVAQARMLYQKTLSVDPGNAGAYFNLGFLSESSGDFKEALNYYEKSVENDPNLAEGYYNMGNVYANLGQVPEAIASYLKTVSINKNHQNAYVNLSILSFKSRDFTGAIRYLEEARLLGYTPPVEYLKSLEPYRKNVK